MTLTNLLNQRSLTRPIYNGPLDLISAQATAAYSLRRMRLGYTGPAISVRRSSDNAVQDIGFTGAGGLNTTALLAFTGANSGFIATWYDQSGLARNAVQTTAANQPRIVNAGVIDQLNGVPAVYTNNCSLAFTQDIFGTVSTVSSVDPTCRSLGALVAGASVDMSLRRAVTQANGWRAETSPGINNDLAGQAGSFVNGVAASGTSDGAPMIPQGFATPSVLTVNSYNATTQSSFLGLLFINAVFPARYLVGWVPEIILFPHIGTLPTADRQTLERNQGAYFGITVA